MHTGDSEKDISHIFLMIFILSYEAVWNYLGNIPPSRDWMSQVPASLNIVVLTCLKLLSGGKKGQNKSCTFGDRCQLTEI